MTKAKAPSTVISLAGRLLSVRMAVHVFNTISGGIGDCMTERIDKLRPTQPFLVLET